MALEDRFLAIQRQVIGVLLDGHVGQQARRGHAAVDDRRRHRFGHDAFAAATGVLRVHVLAHEELIGSTSSFSLTCSPIFTSALPQSWRIAAVRLMERLDARQVSGSSGRRCVCAVRAASAWPPGCGVASSASRAAMSAAMASSNISRWAGSMRSDLAANCTRRSRASSCVSLSIFTSRWRIVRSRCAMVASCCAMTVLLAHHRAQRVDIGDGVECGGIHAAMHSHLHGIG